MYTIKFQTWDSVYPLHEGTNREQQAKSTALQEGEKIWHRRFQIRTLNEMTQWKHMHGWAAINTNCYIPGEDPESQLRKLLKMEIDEKHDPRIHFEYMTFFDNKGELWKVMIFCCNCYIMNETGQTVDSISA